MAMFICGVWVQAPTRGMRMKVVLTLDTASGGEGSAPESVADIGRSGNVAS